MDLHVIVFSTFAFSFSVYATVPLILDVDPETRCVITAYFWLAFYFFLVASLIATKFKKYLDKRAERLLTCGIIFFLVQGGLLRYLLDDAKCDANRDWIMFSLVVQFLFFNASALATLTLAIYVLISLV